MKSVAIETVFVMAIGIALALVANAISPRGLVLTRNYFPTTPESSALPASAKPAADPIATNGSPTPKSQRIPDRLQQKGLQEIGTDEVRQLLDDPRYEQELIVFVDARNDRHYQEGHIPGAYAFDRYYPEQHLPTVLPPCLTAELVVVYCNGGECEDSEFAALALRDAGVAPERIRVYTGGIAEWTAQKLPLESGGRRSGQLENSRP